MKESAFKNSCRQSTYVAADSVLSLTEASRQRLRTFLDTADSASPFQDPQFFGGRGKGEVDLVVERGGRTIFFALGYENFALSRLVPPLKALYVQRGPVAEDAESFASGLLALKELAQERRLCKIRINPQFTEDKAEQIKQACMALGFRPRPSTATLRLNVARDMDDIVARFRKATRYEIRRAERLGITVRRAETDADFSSVHQVYRQRASHKGWSPMPAADFAALSERIRAAPERSAALLSEYKNEILGVVVLLRAGARVHYLLGGIGGNAGNFPAMYPLFYRGIQWAKEIGCTEFDFGGYGPRGVASVNRFKDGFGGDMRTFVPGYTLTLTPLELVRLFRPQHFSR